MNKHIHISNIPLKHISKREIKQLELALIIGALFSPEIKELLEDPVENITWIDSIGAAAGAFARLKAGYSIQDIAEDLGRSELTIRSHLGQKTKAGKIVYNVFDKLARGELIIELPLEKPIPIELENELVKLRDELEKIIKENKSLRDKLSELEQEKIRLENLLGSREQEVSNLRVELEEVMKAKDEISQRLSEIKDKINKLKEYLQNMISIIESITY
ncbi:MAG: transcriptional regulator [Desulfurococcaceae archaeon]